MQKGFLHIVEIIMVSVIVLVILQFAYAPKQNVDWQSMELYTQANDMLFSLDAKAVNWFNSTEVNGIFSSSFSNNTIYSLELRNVMKPQIKVGCICSVVENNNLAAALTSFEINGQKTSFSVTRIDPAQIAFSHDNDVIVTFGPIADSQYNQAYQFLGADKGIVEFRHLASADINNVQRNLFGLVFNSTLPDNPGSSRIEFLSNDSSASYYNIYKYYHNIPIYQNNFTSAADVTTWTTQSGSWSSDSGNYLGSGPDAISYYNTQFQGNYSMRAWFSLAIGTSAKLILYRQDSSNYIAVNFNRSSNSVTVWENISGVPVNKGSASQPLSAGVWYDAKIITGEDGLLRVYLNGTQILTSQPVGLRASSQIAFGAANGQVRFDNLRVAFSEKHTFSQILQSGEKIWPIDNNMGKIILLQKSTPLPACIVNSNIADNNGRTAWLSYTDPASSQEISSMLRNLVVWAAGDVNEVIKNDIKNVPVVTSIYKTYDGDMYQPVEIVLTMGNLYR